MRLATWNINGVVRRLDLLTGWLRAEAPDIVCLQELKVAPAQFPVDALEAAGYGAVWRAEGRWNGVAILARDAVPVLTRLDLPGGEAEAGGTEQARYIEAAIGGRLVASIYAPNGNPRPGPKFDAKLAWMERLRSNAAALAGAGAPVILAGDFNVVPTSLDIYPTRSYDDNALLDPAARKGLEAVIASGYVDAFRQLHPDEPGFTFWDYRRRRWERDAGLRLDMALLNGEAAAGLRAAGIDRAMRAPENASDHAPFWVEMD